ncbi:hypothetical protein FRZ06_06010 [Anoxybacterium hadale]|uniref:Uncharacterized protein n=1 Tax=Anoxybacterium hadale TaxID=3408580 RepID=A0ACD1A9I0_9FIRM|nr:hypothetical protein FRZ06_06010 [Clostridiales bacterium]
MARLFIAYNEREYGFALARAISGIHKGFDVTILSCNSVLENDSILFSEQWDFLLTDCGLDSLFADRLQNQTIKKRSIVLTETIPEMISKQISKEDSGLWQVYKYAPVNEILNDLNFLFAYLTDKKIVNPYLKTSLIGVLGVSGGVGSSSIAIGLARELSRYHDKKILYLSFEELPATEMYVTFGCGCRKISDFLYYLFEKQDDEICSHLEGFTTKDDFGVGFFCPSRGRNDLRSLTKDDLAYLIKYLTDSCSYDYILIDFNHDISPETWELLTYCTRLILVHKDDPVSFQKQRKLEDYFRKGSAPISEDAMIHVRNFNDGGHPSNENVIVIDTDENSFCHQGEQLGIDISQTFGIGIKHIAEIVLLAEFN